jgi:hypothetical protein
VNRETTVNFVDRRPETNSLRDAIHTGAYRGSVAEIVCSGLEVYGRMVPSEDRLVYR